MQLLITLAKEFHSDSLASSRQEMKMKPRQGSEMHMS